MAERERGPKEPEICFVSGCKDVEKRSVSSKKYQGAMPGSSLKGKAGRRIPLCKRHYREFKKSTKQDREYERLGW